ncbi:DNA glycosylase AlkZ-like family protein [Arthrobacter sp. ATA002]|uniref:DNA glycosylase AlkZ-like family protein n=1 Tax=Arthrobacter sp. ATA002 TaxID=2991715 RepID=UPI003FA47C28
MPLRRSHTTLSRADLSRMTLQRQYLLAPANVSEVELTRHLVGLQAQNPWSWYTAFFRRAGGLSPEQPSARLGDRSLVRMSAMLATIHLMTATDAASLRFHTQLLHERTLASSFGREVRDVDLSTVTAAAKDLLETQPRTLNEPGAELGKRWPDTRPDALAMVARFMLPLVQIPLVGSGGAADRSLTPHWTSGPKAALSQQCPLNRCCSATSEHSVRQP